MASEEPSVVVADEAALDEAYNEDDAESDTQSLTSSVTQYVYENGRRYNSYRSGSYWGPNDESQQKNLDLAHHVFVLTLNGALFLAPIGDSPQRVLDLGTGTGSWAIDFADQYPSASILGTDLSPIQPHWVPPNLQFEIHDFCSSWDFKRDSFDFIHARSLYGCVADYAEFYKEIYNHLKPGGWFEQDEMAISPQSDDGSVDGSAIQQWGPSGLEAAQKFGKSLSIVYDTKKYMEDAGFVNVTYKKMKWPIGPWPKHEQLKRIGLYNRLTWNAGMEGWAMFLFTHFLGWSAEQVHVFCAQTRKDLWNKSIHAWQDVSFCYGQKPLADTEQG